ncbi:uncharacterized protein HMPREF1541_09388 [Cyphellophora europaea CBS 101466]|uniref:Cytochrome P450 n=1 Tax=Cyphellophora europaea (strain CBS 101466) TaxID=1220924 RepID=W2SA03_CYPE1|nr:uncharacterized protein HMPREF1541_09388 [Cyphellophora europaea CBS 101466]ETN45556.1 hypothetical protein HMPREF1541_09388 [Cyphellophora europaea CBS 101466]
MLSAASDLLSQPRHLALGLLFVAAAYTISTLSYNLLLHPLRKFPGPPLAKISRLWARHGNLYGQKSERVHAAHLKYGPVVRVGPNELSFASPAAVREIYTSDVFVKEEVFYRAKRIFHENHMMSFRDPEAHRQRRKLLSRGFSQAAMLDFEANISDKIETMLNQWAARCVDGSIDIYPWSHWLGFDIVYHLMFDEDPGSIRAGKPHEVMPYLRAWKPTFIYKEFMPSLEQWGVWLPGHVGGYFRDVNTWKNYAVKIVQRLRQRGAKSPFLRNVLNGDKDGFLGRPLTDSEIAEESMGGMFGGSGTTANTFVYVVWACLQRPDVVEKLKVELNSHFGDRSQVPDYKSCATLPYLQAVISETLRRYPTIIATLPRTARQQIDVAGVRVPAGTTVGTQNYTIHRDPEAFPDAEAFRPDRWLEEEGEQARKDAWTPFSVGTRKCVGINLAQMELTKLVAAFFLRFDGEIDKSMTDADMRMYDTFNAAPAGAKLLVQLREDKA